MRRFARVELGEDTVPDESTILRFRHLLEQHQLTAQMVEAVKTLLTDKRLLLKAGTIVDATIMAAPSSTKNATKTRDPEMKQTRKGNQWYFGMKIHVGTDTRDVVHSLTTTDAAQADITQLPHLVHGQESTLYGDKAYKADDKLHWEAPNARNRARREPSNRLHPVTWRPRRPEAHKRSTSLRTPYLCRASLTLSEMLVDNRTRLALQAIVARRALYR